MTTKVEGGPPLCLNCGKRLRRYHWRGHEGFEGREWGGYGDGHFCGLRCGYDWAVMYIGRKPELSLALHEAMVRIIAERSRAAPSEAAVETREGEDGDT